jgi:hypothetical protein
MAGIQKLVEYFRKQDLTGDDIYKMIQKYPVPYSQLNKYKSISQLLGKEGYAVILYEVSRNSGHWVCMVEQNNGKSVYFQDSYGYPPDAPITHGMVPYDKANFPLYLSELIEKEQRPFDYNKKDFQSKNPNTGDCGRWACLKCLLKEVPNDSFRHLFFNNQDAYLKPDNLVVLLTIQGLNNINDFYTDPKNTLRLR